MEVGHEHARARRAGRHQAAVLVDVLDHAGVVEQVDAVVALAFGAEQALGGGVDVERGDAERLSQPVGHGVRAQLMLVDMARGAILSRPASCSSASAWRPTGRR